MTLRSGRPLLGGGRGRFERAATFIYHDAVKLVGMTSHNNAGPTGPGSLIAGVLAVLLILPFLILGLVAAVAIGAAAVVAGLVLSAVSRIRAYVARSSNEGRRNVRVIRRE